jgi:hypothetical protein
MLMHDQAARIVLWLFVGASGRASGARHWGGAATDQLGGGHPAIERNRNEQVQARV